MLRVMGHAFSVAFMHCYHCGYVLWSLCLCDAKVGGISGLCVMLYALLFCIATITGGDERIKR